ncbi:MAG: hypothetical protein PHV34_23000 [Verrucomicrobiae bacterium]|nr:hypothetical protein [Verrucomicrobiae bacterium]
MKSQEFVDPDLQAGGGVSGANPSNGRNLTLVSPSKAELDARVEQARQQMLELRRQQDELERQRQDLEELRRRVEEFERGKNELVEQLARSVGEIEKEEVEASKRVSVLANYRNVFQDYVGQLQDVRQNDWSADEIKQQLPQAASLLEEARNELAKGRSQISAYVEDGGAPVAMPAPRMMDEGGCMPMQSMMPFSFKEEFIKGFARYLPLIIALVLIALILRR